MTPLTLMTRRFLAVASAATLELGLMHVGPHPEANFAISLLAALYALIG